MDPVTVVLVSSILGGLGIAFFMVRRQGHGPSSLTDAPMPPVTTDVINIAHIRAAGLGGLGLFAMALVVAWFVPVIRLALGAGVLFGALLGAVMILRRRRNGPLPSSGGSAGANVILSIEQPAACTSDETDRPPNRLRIAVARRAV